MKSAVSSTRIIAALSLTLCLANLLLIVYQQRLLNRIPSPDRDGIYEDDMYLERLLPWQFDEAAMVIQKNRQFSLIDDEAWAKTLPGNRGFVRLGPKGRSFAVALYHQLHCVNAIRFSYTVARDGLVTDPEILESKIGHDNHCFQFLRQSILCSADNSLIPVDIQNQSFSHAGFGVAHRCINWAQVRQFVLEDEAKWDGIPFLMGRTIGKEE